MRKGIALSGAMIAFAFAAQAVVIEHWDMADDTQYQTSDNGIVLPASDTNAQAVAQTPGDSLFIYAPTNASLYSNKAALSSTMNLADGIVRLTIKTDSIDFSTNSASNSKFEVALWNSAGDYFIALGYIDAVDKIKASASYSDDSYNPLGRLVNGLAGTPSSDLVLEINYARGEFYVSAPGGWDYSTVDVYTNTFDTTAFQDVSRIQIRYANMTVGDQVVLDDITIEQIPEPATLGLIGLVGGGLLFLRRRFSIG